MFPYEAKDIFASYVKPLLNFFLALFLLWSDRNFCTFIPWEECGSRDQEKKRERVSTSIRMTKLKYKQIEFSHSAGRNAKRHNLFGKSLLVNSKFKQPLAI